MRGGRRIEIAFGVLLLAGACAGAWLWFGPDPKLVVPPAHAPHPLRPAVQPGRVAGAPEDEPPVEDPLPPPVAAGAPDGPTRHDLEAGMEKVKKHVARCQSLEQVSGTLTVRVVIARSGNVQSVSVLPPFDKTATGDCVAKAVRREASFPRFRGELSPTVELIFPFFFRSGAEGVL